MEIREVDCDKGTYVPFRDLPELTWFWWSEDLFFKVRGAAWRRDDYRFGAMRFNSDQSYTWHTPNDVHMVQPVKIMTIEYCIEK